MNNFKLTDLLDMEILQHIQDSLCEYVKISAVITDEEGNPITRASNATEFCSEYIRKTEKGLVRCMECDKLGAVRSNKTGKPAVYLCHAGLIDFAAPILLKDRIIGSVVGGQVRPHQFDEEKFRETAEELGIDPEEYVSAARETYGLSVHEVERAAHFLAEIAKSVSLMAYNNYNIIGSSQKTERDARSRTKVITGISEDLRVGMKEWLDTVRDVSDRFGENPELSSEFKNVLSKGQEMYSVIDGAVDYLHFSGGKVEFSEGKYDVRELVSDTVRACEEEASQNGVGLSVHFADDLPESFIGSSGRIGQIINKLLMYAIQYNKKRGDIVVSVSCKRKLYAVELIFEISDEQSSLDNVFFDKASEYVERENMDVLDEGETKSFDFLLIPQLVEQLAGTIGAEGSEGGGMKFTLTVPQLIGRTV